MTKENFKITIIDDNPEDINLLLENLKSDYVINAALNAEEALELLKQQQPDLILLDVNMPGMNGYELCKKLKSDPVFSNIDIIFLSANNSTEEIIKGLELGALDYIVKPYDTTLLRSKINKTVQRLHSSQELQRKASEANQIVFTMMNESSALSTTISYFRNCFSANTLQELLKATINTLSSVQLNSVVYFHAADQNLFLSSNGQATMLETELLKRLSNYPEPFFEQGERLFLVQKQLVVLIKNMPTTEEKRGSLKDHLMTLFEGCSAKLAYFDKLNQDSEQKLKNISSAISESQSALADIQTKQEQHKKQSMEMLDAMIADVEHILFSLGLSEAQEQALLGSLSAAGQKQLEHIESGLQLDERIKSCVLKLSKAATDALS